MKLIDAHAHLAHQAQGIDRIVESGVFEQIWLMDLSGVGSLDNIRLPTGRSCSTRSSGTTDSSSPSVSSTWTTTNRTGSMHSARWASSA